MVKQTNDISKKVHSKPLPTSFFFDAHPEEDTNHPSEKGHSRSPPI